MFPRQDRGTTYHPARWVKPWIGLRPGCESTGWATKPYRLRASSRLYTNLVGTLRSDFRNSRLLKPSCN